MRYASEEKLEIIRLVESSHLGSNARWISLEWPGPPSTAGMRGI